MGGAQFFLILASTSYFPSPHPPKVVLGVKQYFTVADSVSPMTSDSEQSPVVLVFLLSPDPVPCLPRWPYLSKLAPSSWAGLQPAPGRQPGLGIPLLAAGNAALSCSSSSGCAGPSTEPQWLLRFLIIIPLEAGPPPCPAPYLGAAPSVQVVLRTLYTGIDCLLLTFRAGLHLSGCCWLQPECPCPSGGLS